MKISTRFTFLTILLLVGIVAMQCNDDDEVSPDQTAYNNANINNGGRLYDKFWADETDFTTPSDASVNLTYIIDNGDFYRCKQCHAWDQKGNLESYIDRGPTTSRPNISSIDLTTHIPGMTNLELFDEIKNDGGASVDPARTADGTNVGLGGDNMPDYGKILTDAQIWDLVKFLKKGTLDTDQLYDITTTGSYPTGSRTFSNVGKDGDPTAGKLFFNTNCASCHGDNGRDDGNGTILAINEQIGKSIGEFAREKPYELQHKSRYGNLGSSPTMLGVPEASLDDIKNMLKALSDSNNYPDL